HHVNETGTAVWEALREPRNLDEIVAQVGVRFRGDPVVMTSHIEAFVDGLVARNLVVPAELRP
ncbi:MAG: PqqD family protein, partial [Bryobacteraceae bacterium]